MRSAPAAIFVAAAVVLTAGSGRVDAAEIELGYSGLRASGDLTHGGVLAVASPRGGGRLRLVVELSGQSGSAAGGERLRELGLFAGAALAPWRDGRLSPFVSFKAGAVNFVIPDVLVV